MQILYVLTVTRGEECRDGSQTWSWRRGWQSCMTQKWVIEDNIACIQWQLFPNSCCIYCSRKWFVNDSFVRINWLDLWLPGIRTKDRDACCWLCPPVVKGLVCSKGAQRQSIRSVGRKGREKRFWWRGTSSILSPTADGECSEAWVICANEWLIHCVCIAIMFGPQKHST